MEVTSFLAKLWVDHSNTVLTLCVWAIVGIIITSPVLLAESVYRFRQIGNTYHFQGFYARRRRYYRRQIMLYSLVCCSVLLGMLVLWIV